MSGPARRAAATLGWGTAAVVPGAFLAVFFAYPVLTVVVEGLSGAGSAGVVTSAAFRSVAWFTLWQAAASTALTVAVALPAAVAARLAPRWRRLVRAAVTVPFVLPTVVVAGAFEELFAATGLDDGGLRLRHTVWAVLLAHLFFNYAVVVRIVGAHWAGLDARVEDQARVLGASPVRTFLEVTWPRIRAAVASAASIVFLFSFTSFALILVLGGPTRATIETEIHRYAVVRLDPAAAASIAVVQLVAVVAVVAVAGRLERRRVAATRAAVSGPPPSRRALVGVATMTAVVLGLPLAVLVERSLAVGDGHSLANFAGLADRPPVLPASPLDALATSLVYAVVAVALAVVIGGLASLVVVHGRRAPARVLDLGLTLPLGTSAVTIGFGLLLALDEPPIDWRTAWWIVPVAHALVGVPFVVRSVVPVLRAVDDRLREAAAVLGASPARVRREIDLPLGARGLVVGAGFAFAVSIGEFGATAFLPRRGDDVTAPLVLFRLLGTPGDELRGRAMALAVVLAAVTALAAAAVESVRAGERPGL